MRHLTLNTQRQFQTEVIFHPSVLKTLAEDASLIFLVDETLPKAVLDPLLKSREVRLIKLPAQEKSKTWETVETVIDQLEQMNVSRTTTLCAVGGGALTDAAAFIASIYLRGLTLYLVPTTLLGMVDASVGGKTAINGRVKNRVGTFYPASKIFIDSTFLTSMPKALMAEGMSEIIKIALIKDAPFVKLLEDQALSKTEMIERAIALKMDTVTNDLTDQSERLLLNFGHTTGHALEALHHFSYSHGACIAAGMVLDTAHQPLGNRVLKLLTQYGCFTPIPFEKTQLRPFIEGDKKRTDASLDWITLEAIGKAKITRISIDACIDQIPNNYPQLEAKNE